MATRDSEKFVPLGRLVDERGESPGEAAWVRSRAIDLVLSMEPFRAPQGRKQRLLLSLGQGWVRRRAVWLRPVTIGALLIGSGALASAALTSWPARIVRSFDFESSARPPGARVVVTTDWPAAQPIPAPIPPTPPRPPAVVRRLPAEVHPRRPSFVPPSDDPSLLIEATRALRVEGDPKLARALAARYLEKQPAGALADEALVISIEAAIDHHDPDAAVLAAKYLAQFPRGAFRSLAERTLAPADRR